MSVTDVARLRAQLAVLKKTVVDEQAAARDLSNQLRLKDVRIRDLEQMLDLKNIHVVNLEKRVESLIQSSAAAAAAAPASFSLPFGSLLKKKKHSPNPDNQTSSNQDLELMFEQMESKAIENDDLKDQLRNLQEVAQISSLKLNHAESTIAALTHETQRLESLTTSLQSQLLKWKDALDSNKKWTKECVNRVTARFLDWSIVGEGILGILKLMDAMDLVGNKVAWGLVSNINREGEASGSPQVLLDESFAQAMKFIYQIRDYFIYSGPVLSINSETINASFEYLSQISAGLPPPALSSCMPLLQQSCKAVTLLSHHQITILSNLSKSSHAIANQQRLQGRSSVSSALTQAPVNTVQSRSSIASFKSMQSLVLDGDLTDNADWDSAIIQDLKALDERMQDLLKAFESMHEEQGTIIEKRPAGDPASKRASSARTIKFKHFFTLHMQILHIVYKRLTKHWIFKFQEAKIVPDALFAEFLELSESGDGVGEGFVGEMDDYSVTGDIFRKLGVVAVNIQNLEFDKFIDEQSKATLVSISTQTTHPSETTTTTATSPISTTATTTVSTQSTLPRTQATDTQTSPVLLPTLVDTSAQSRPVTFNVETNTVSMPLVAVSVSTQIQQKSSSYCVDVGSEPPLPVHMTTVSTQVEDVRAGNMDAADTERDDTQGGHFEAIGTSNGAVVGGGGGGGKKKKKKSGAKKKSTVRNEAHANGDVKPQCSLNSSTSSIDVELSTSPALEMNIPGSNTIPDASNRSIETQTDSSPVDALALVPDTTSDPHPNSYHSQKVFKVTATASVSKISLPSSLFADLRTSIAEESYDAAVEVVVEKEGVLSPVWDVTRISQVLEEARINEAKVAELERVITEMRNWTQN